MSEELSRVGFFRELHNNPSLPSIREAVRTIRHPDETQILAYLETGICLAACGGVQRDVLDPLSDRMTSPDMMTDGAWLWPGELPYYVRAHGVELPPKFVDHMRKRGWVVSEANDAEVKQLCDRLRWEWQV